MGKGKKVRGKYEATNHSKAKCFLHILGEAEIHSVTKSQNMEIVNSHYTGKVWEKKKLSKVSQIFWLKQKSILFPKYGKSEFP